ncbi:hypothetical protein F5Y16DRAFT_398178 [Xylariaceae sp. FL0255]|nr:hypothetical protein F5Y16DRAFT_398178 [Xylariaceae sp. FL0255]
MFPSSLFYLLVACLFVDSALSSPSHAAHSPVLKPRLSEGAKSAISVVVTLTFIGLVASLAIFCVIRSRAKALQKPVRAPAAIAASEGIHFDESFIRTKGEGAYMSPASPQVPYNNKSVKFEEAGYSGGGGEESSSSSDVIGNIPQPPQIYAPPQHLTHQTPAQYMAVYPGQQGDYSHLGITSNDQNMGIVYAGPSYTQYQPQPALQPPQIQPMPIYHQTIQPDGTSAVSVITNDTSNNYLQVQGQQRLQDYKYQTPDQIAGPTPVVYHSPQSMQQFQQYHTNPEQVSYINNNHLQPNMSRENSNSGSSDHVYHPTPTLEPVSTGLYPSSTQMGHSASDTTVAAHPGVSATMNGYEALDLDRFSAGFDLEDAAPYYHDFTGARGYSAPPTQLSELPEQRNPVEMMGEGHTRELP